MACWVSARLKHSFEFYIHAANHYTEHIYQEMKAKIADIENNMPGEIQGSDFQKAKGFVFEYERSEITPYHQEGRIHIRHLIFFGFGLSTILLYLTAAVGVMGCLSWHIKTAWAALISHFLFFSVFVYELVFPVLILKKWQAMLDPFGESIAPLPKLSVFSTVFNSATIIPLMVFGGAAALTVLCLKRNTEKGCHKTAIS